MTREFRRREGRAAKRGGKFFNSRSQIHRRTDAGEIQPVGAPNIAVEHLADMQRHSKSPATIVILRGRHCGNVRACLTGRLKDLAANLDDGPVVASDRENCEQPITHEFEDFATMSGDRWDLAIE